MEKISGKDNRKLKKTASRLRKGDIFIQNILSCYRTVVKKCSCKPPIVELSFNFGDCLLEKSQVSFIIKKCGYL